MRKEVLAGTMAKKIILICIAGVSLFLGLLLFFSTMPVLNDPSGCFVVKVALNENFERGEYGAVELTEYDEAAILNCLAKYEEQRQLERYRGGRVGDCEIELYIGSVDGLKTIKLGNENFTCDTSGSLKHRIINGDKLKEELRSLITNG